MHEDRLVVRLPIGFRTRQNARGRLIAAALHRAWRRDPPPTPSLTAADWRAIAPPLVASNAAGLAWRVVEGTALVEDPAIAALRDARRFQAIHGVLLGRQLAEALDRLDAAGVPALTAKGWAAARRYPEPGLRPVGDIDLYVRASDFARAREVFADATLPVDLHRGFHELDDRDEGDLFARARLVDIDGAGRAARLPSAEDELRLLALHWLKHGAARPTGLVDVAVALEARPAGFDWGRFTDGDARRTAWALAALGLAERLLGAHLDDTPVAARARRLPSWLERAVLAQWGAGDRYRAPIASIQEPLALATALWHRWPNAVEATVGIGAGPGALPRLPYQVAHCALRVGAYLALRWRRRREAGLPIVGAEE